MGGYCASQGADGEDGAGGWCVFCLRLIASRVGWISAGRGASSGGSEREVRGAGRAQW